jgi:hypothetical protein
MAKIIRVRGDEIIVDENRARPKPFHSPSEALQTHCDLLDWVDSEHGFEVIRGIVNRHAETTGLDENGDEVPGDDDGIAEGYRSMLWDTVNHNSTMFVSAHMCDQLQALIPAFEEEPFWPTDMPDEKGTVLFEAAIRSGMSDQTDERYEDDTPLEYWLKGFAYRRVHGTYAEVARRGVEMRIHIAEPPSELGQTMENDRIRAFAEHGGVMVWPLFDAGEFFIAGNMWELSGCPPVLPMPFVGLPFGPRVDHDLDKRTDMFQTRQILVTLFRLIWQHILVEDPIGRPERRRMGRIAAKHKRLPDDGEEIKVRHLRRLEGEGEPTPRDTEPGEGHPLTYRIIVRGHPRDQYYPSLGPARVDGQWNAASHRKIWISAHERGPEDAPLVLKHNLDAVVR